MMQEKVEYIHNNPIRWRYVEEPSDWRYSSARNYEGRDELISVELEW